MAIAPEKLDDVPTQSASKPGQLAIFATQCDLELARIAISTDIYYTQPWHIGTGPGGGRFSATLGPQECYMLGDNSPQSRDSRYMAPTDLSDITGVARWIYWPLSRRHTFR
jgi:hypothetical protein